MQPDAGSHSSRDSKLIPVQRTPHAAPTTIEHRPVDHRRLHVLVAEQLLDGVNVVAGFEQMCCERMSQCVRRRGRGDARRLHGLPHSPLQILRVCMMAALRPDRGSMRLILRR